MIVTDALLPGVAQMHTGAWFDPSAPPVPSDQIFQLTVSTLGRLADVREFEDIVVKSRAPAPSVPQLGTIPAAPTTAALVRVRDVARVELSQQSFGTFSGLSGKKAATH